MKVFTNDFEDRLVSIIGTVLVLLSFYWSLESSEG